MRNSTTNTNWYRCSSRAKRHGLSLIEVVVMASVSSMMLVMVTGWIHQTMKQSTRFRTEHREQLAVSRLSKHFRKHVWLSSAVDLSDPKSVSLTNLQGDQFTYKLEDQQIHFVHQNSSEATQAIERFVLPRLSNVTFEQTAGSRVALKLETSASAKPNGASEHTRRIHLIVEPTLARWLPATESTLEPATESDSDIEEASQ